MPDSCHVVERRFSLAKRLHEAEVMDNPWLDGSAHRKALAGLARLNRLSLTAATIWTELMRLAASDGRKTIRVLDLACGGGDITRRLVQLAGRSGLPFQFEGCDVSPRAVRFASEAAARQKLDCRFFQFDVCDGPLPHGYDYYVSSLFLHHLTEDQVIELLHRVSQSVEQGCVFVDLDRTAGGFVLACLIPRLVSLSPVVHVDAVRSVRAAFAFEEVESLAQRAGLRRVHLFRRWPCRWVLSWQREHFFGE